MSLDCFGKILLGGNVEFWFPSDVAIRTEIDPGDIEELDQIDALRGEGVFFTISDDPGGGDATRLWLEAGDW